MPRTLGGSKPKTAGESPAATWPHTPVRRPMLSGSPQQHLNFVTTPLPDSIQPLLDRTGHVRENVVGIAAHQSYGADHNHQNHRQHHCIFSDVLTLVFMPQITHDTHHGVAFLFEPASPSRLSLIHI